MPNHVTNVITAPAEVVEAIIRVNTPEETAERHAQLEQMAENFRKRTGNEPDWVASDRAEIEANKRFVDFNMLVPMPKEVEGTTVGTNGEGLFSEAGWYGWSLRYWGTKWNGYDTEILKLEDDRLRLQFDTAWSHPEPIINALSQKFPEAVLEVEWADEDLGSNLGSYKIQGGEVTDLVQPDYREDEDLALGMAVRIKYGQTLEEYKAERLADDLDSARRYVQRKRIEARTDEDPGYGYEGLDDDIIQAITTEEQAESVWSADSELFNQLVTKGA